MAGILPAIFIVFGSSNRREEKCSKATFMEIEVNNIYTPKTNMKEELANCYEWYLKNKEYIKRRDYDENEKIILKNIKKS